ncbi:MAG: aa3-type cytochrome c oxidase subunit IV [Hyphomicrobium sp.]|uniref:aa3-type cytochrome c oxidase subunit IV n=1 Tax=Hyphomicrobium sp. TaxID=82 RepID=UPI001322E8AD|nr:aa3-type cytochrome c oxidase subunit IV [Hyphomicrobium sp.]KAB2942595.1 MAG: aa3-type cytochrome c oxidase subunit IV [Hyphomicrobium sp.]MBZ0208577.1 aa3-type cytochrome c oxidase subunit IV [Hyphomicrobium sp.]MCZ7594741.1 aa3-type cytochrome c oxidase subunit IV [Hyphomicrobium sp.]
MAKVQRVRLAEGEIAAEDDYAEHLRDYRKFVRGVQLVIAGVATVLLLLAFFLL